MYANCQSILHVSNNEFLHLLSVNNDKNTMKDLQNAEQRLTKVDSSLQRVNSLLLTGFRKRGTIDYEPSRKLIFFKLSSSPSDYLYYSLWVCKFPQSLNININDRWQFWPINEDGLRIESRHLGCGFPQFSMLISGARQQTDRRYTTANH